jgi:hypothetical protein
MPRSSAKNRVVRSAAAALGGKISARTVRIPITNVFMDGDYTGLLNVGSKRVPLNVILDTGSSSLAVDGTAYDVKKDTTAAITDIAQEVEYADQSNWIGGVVLTDVAVGVDKPLVLPKVNVAVAYHATKSMFRKSQGILGLAYTRLNNAFKMPGKTIPPQYTFNQIQEGKVTYIEPYFTELEKAGLVADKFAFYTRRSMINMSTTRPGADPLNAGWLILGGGEESTDLYDGKFQVARVVHDLYYNTNLKQVIVGSNTPIEVEAPTRASGNISNAIVDSGTNSLMLDESLFEKIAKSLSTSQGSSLGDAMEAGYVAMNKLNLADWPTITFVLEGALGEDVKLVVTPENYWQTDAPRKGQATAVLFGDSGQGGGQSILGLPLMNNYFTIFDRSVNKGLGVISFAPLKSAAAVPRKKQRTPRHR